MEYYLYIANLEEGPFKYNAFFQEFPMMDIYANSLSELIHLARENLREQKKLYINKGWVYPEHIDPIEGGLLVSSHRYDLEIYGEETLLEKDLNLEGIFIEKD